MCQKTYLYFILGKGEFSLSCNWQFEWQHVELRGMWCIHLFLLLILFYFSPQWIYLIYFLLSDLKQGMFITYISVCETHTCWFWFLSFYFLTPLTGTISASKPAELTNVLEICNIVFTSMFTLEMFLKLTAFGFFEYLRNPYNIFDGIIVIIRFVIYQM